MYHIHIHYLIYTNLIYDKRRFCPLQSETLNLDRRKDERHRRLKIFFAGAKQKRVARLQQAQKVLGKEQHTVCREGSPTVLERFLFTCCSSFGGLVVLDGSLEN